MTAGDADEDILLVLPDEHRDAFKEPLGRVYTDVEALLADSGEPIIAVGDVVTATLLEAGYRPAVSVVDGQTERSPVEAEVRQRTKTIDHVIEVANPAATITRSLTSGLVAAIDAREPTRIEVDGEEDLAVIPAILAAPHGATVLYGQPREGMVAVPITEETIEEVRSMVSHLEGDEEAMLALLE